MGEYKTIAVDFDGVIASYSGWKGVGVFGDPIAGVKDALCKLKSLGYAIVIFTTRGEIGDIQQYLDGHKIPYDHINCNPQNSVHMNPGKPIADVYVDDRAICFQGVWSNTFVDNILNLKPWYSHNSRRPEFLSIAYKLADLFGEKEISYGDAYFSDAYSPAERWMSVKRKMVRLDNFHKQSSFGSLREGESLLDTWSDIAVYAVMELMILGSPKEIALEGGNSKTDADLNRPIRLNIGCGAKKRDGYLGVDIRPIPGIVDIVCDVGSQKLPLPDKSVRSIYSIHAFEHIQDIIFLMNEMWRVMEWDGRLEIHVPHKDCVLAWQDPTHKRYFVEESLKYFCGEYLRKYDLDYGIRCGFRQEEVVKYVPDDRPEYLTMIKFVLVKDREHAARYGFDGI